MNDYGFNLPNSRGLEFVLQKFHWVLNQCNKNKCKDILFHKCNGLFKGCVVKVLPIRKVLWAKHRDPVIISCLLLLEELDPSHNNPFQSQSKHMDMLGCWRSRVFQLPRISPWLISSAAVFIPHIISEWILSTYFSISINSTFSAYKINFQKLI